MYAIRLILLNRKAMFGRGISNVFKRESKKDPKTKNQNTGMLSSGFESWKLVSLLVHLTFSIGVDGTIVPSSRRDLELLGVTDGIINNVTDVISSACATCIEMHKALDAKEMKYSEHKRILYLISISKYHHLRLCVLKKVFSKLRLKQKISDEIIASFYRTALAGNKHHYMFHLLFAKLRLGCNLIAFDTEMSESSHIPYVKDAYDHSSKRPGQRLDEMLSFILDKKLVQFLAPLLLDIDRARIPPLIRAAPSAKYGASPSYKYVTIINLVRP